MNNAYDAYVSNPRYSEGGLEDAKEKEELTVARKIDVQNGAQAELDAIAPQTTEKADPFETVQTIAGAAVRASENVAGGLSGAIENTLTLAVGRENIDKGNEWMKQNMPDWYNGMVQELQPKGTVDEVTQEMTKFIAPFGVLMKGAAATRAVLGLKSGIVFDAALAEVITSGAALDPHMERLASFAKEMGVENQMIGWLADNEDETESEGRLKNIIENTGLTATMALAFKSAAMTFKGLKRFKEFHTPKPAEAVEEVVEKAAVKAPEPAASEAAPVILHDPARLTPAEKDYFDIIFNSKADLDELLDDVPSATMTPDGIAISPDDIDGFIRYIDDTVTRADVGERLPPGFRNDRLINRLRGKIDDLDVKALDESKEDINKKMDKIIDKLKDS